MSEPSRAERRRSARSGAAPPPKRRDPMRGIYIALGIVIVLVFAGFAISNGIARHKHDRAAAFDLATPTPGPKSTSKPIQLRDLEPIGKPTGFPIPDVHKMKLSDTAAGGQGQPVDGIPCENMEVGVLHIHSHLTLIYNGTQVQVPEYIGFAPSANGGCLYWLHTHGPDGIIHVEAGDVSAPAGGPYTLGMFFDIWGQPLSRTQIGPFKGDVTAFVNGVPYAGTLGAIPLRAHQRITLEVGNPVVPPPNYALPPSD